MTEPEQVAVVGIGCRFPDANQPAGYWRLLCDGVDAVREIPADRFSIDSYFDPNPDTAGRTYSRWGGFLDDLAGFDAAFFGISPREAERMDPQQRHLLEVACDALDDAGIARSTIEGTRVGVFMGEIAVNYLDLAARLPDFDVHAVTGTARSVLSGRLSFALDARGPSVSVDSACSSSLVALHLAYRSVRAGESELALAGGTNVVLLPDEGIAYSRGRMLAMDGHCKFADASGDGFVRSDGIGVVVLKPLSKALADGDRVYAVIMGSATNNDGRSSGYLLTPSEEGQVAMLRAALADAGIDPGRLDYVEAHGTGTRVGDVVELRALAEVVGAGRTPESPCLVGSVKTNIGHTEGASGIAGFIKTVLSLHHRKIPANLHLTEPNAAIDWAHSGLTVPTATAPWPHEHRAVAGVSSFGIAGTNAHVVVAEPEPPMPELLPAPLPAMESLIMPVSAADPAALRLLTAAYVELLRDRPPGDARAICAAAAQRRDHLPFRLAVSGPDGDAIAGALAAAQPPAGAADQATRVAFVFPGQGSQWPGMGRDLLATEPVFRAAMHDCAEVIAEHSGWSLLDVLADDSPDALTALDVVQPALWATQVSLAALWRSWGIEPDVVIGHSMGEVAAAHVSGALDLADAAKVVCVRSKLARQVSGIGAMAVVGLSAAETAEVLGEDLSIAAYNSPATTVISGSADRVRATVKDLTDRGVFAHLVRVDFASHSPIMDPICDQLLEALADLRPKPVEVRFRSTVRGSDLNGIELDAGYWADNLRQPVLFAEAVAAEVRSSAAVFLEVSPHPALVDALSGCGVQRAIGTLARGEPGLAAMHARLAELYTEGAPVNWHSVYRGHAPQHDLPPYPWQHQRQWLPVSPAGRPPATVGRATGKVSYLAEHRVRGVPILPGMVTVDLALTAAREAFDSGPVELTDVRFLEPLYLTEGEPSLRVELTDGRFTVSGQDTNGSWITLTSGMARPAPSNGRAPVDPAIWRSRCTARLDIADFYAGHRASGNDWGPSFQAITELYRGGDGLFGMLDLPTPLRGQLRDHSFHPALLDACGQLAAASTCGPFVGESIACVRWYGRPGPSVVAYLDGHHDDGSSFGGDLRVVTPDGDPLIEITGLRSRLLKRAAEQPEDEWLHELQWRRLPRATGATGATGAAGPARRWLLVGESILPAHRLPGQVGTELGALDDELGVAFSASGDQDCEGLVTLVRSLTTRTGATRLWVITRGSQAAVESDTVPSPEGATLWGLARAIAAEHPRLGVTAIDLPAQPSADDIAALLDELAQPATEQQVALREGSRYAARLVPYSASSNTGVPQPRGSQIRVDITVTSDGCPGLWSCVGTVAAVGPEVRHPAPGDVVLALGHGRASSSALVDAALAMPVPPGLSTAEAVTIPHTYAPALYGLRDLARLRAGETVQVHPATSALSAAAIRIARLFGARVVAKADRAEDRAMLALAGVPEPTGRVDVVFATGMAAPAAETERYVQLGGAVPADSQRYASYSHVNIAALPSQLMSDLFHDVATMVRRGELGPLPFRQIHGRVSVGIDGRNPACLITGGLGDLGVVVGDLLIDRGIRNLILIGRSPMPPQRAATLKRWRDGGAEVEYHQIDVADEPALQALLDRPICGVVHTAGIGIHSPVTELSADELRSVLHPKLNGTAALHRVLADRPLDFFVLFSSAAAVLPSPLLGAYAAANSYLDAFALHRTARGLPALSIGWGFWETGMAVRLNGPGRLRVPAGLASFTPARGAAVLGRLLDQGACGHVVVTPADWPTYVDTYPDQPTRRMMMEVATPSISAPNSSPAGEEVTFASNDEPGEQPVGTAERIAELVAEVLHLPPESVDCRRTLNKLGMDSLMATEIRTRIMSSYGVNLPLSTFLSGSSVSDVAAALSGSA